MKKNIKELATGKNNVLTKAQTKAIKGGDGPPTRISNSSNGG